MQVWRSTCYAQPQILHKPQVSTPKGTIVDLKFNCLPFNTVNVIAFIVTYLFLNFFCIRGLLQETSPQFRTTTNISLSEPRMHHGYEIPVMYAFHWCSPKTQNVEAQHENRGQFIISCSGQTYGVTKSQEKNMVGKMCQNSFWGQFQDSSPPSNYIVDWFNGMHFAFI